ncbi:hypothetical protein [Burkholderia sp. TSV86]|uniref:hypothetical protein n=1 Tax=Burkholderia sp. TSV86 TaxID=1385594 RepID=UPI0018D23B4D|nr:hypothetical protein [Burkholderia sp. TSV86]
MNSYDQLQAALLDGHIDACGAFLASRRESDAGFAEYWYWLAQMHYRSSRFLQAADVCFKLTREASAFGMHFHCFADICAHLGVKDIGIAGLEMLASKPELGLASSYYVRLCGNHYLGEDEAVLELQRDASVPAACMSEHHRARSVMRRHGIAAGIDAFHRTYCSRQAVAELWPAQDLEHYWCGQRDLPKHLTIKGFSCGFGDFIQWSRYARVLRALGVAIAYDAQFDGLWDEGPIDDHARHLASQLKAADFVFGRNDTSMWTHAFALFSSLFPVLGYGEMGRYLAPGDDDRVEQIVRTIRQRAQGRQCIGIFWSSIESNNLYASRSLRLTHLTPLWDVSDDIHWVVMQRGHERMRWDNGPYAQDPRRCTNLPAATSLAQTLGIMDRLDGFVGNDGVLSHAAGALNKPGYLLLNARCADWRYEQYAGATPWYSSLQLLRPETMGGWDGLAATLASKIERGSAY